MNELEIFKLFGSILIDNDKANESLDKTEKKGQGIGKTLGGMIGTAAKWGAALGAGALAVGGAMFGMASRAGDAADRILDLAAITGMSSDEIQRWERVSKVAGVSLDSMTNASQKLTRQLNTMDVEGNKSREALEGLGLSVEEISAMNADERMNAITEALSGVEDTTERARLGTDLLGGSWKEIAPIVDMGAEAMQNAKDSANIISEDDLNKANEFRIRVAEMKDQLGFFFMQMSINVIPIMQTFMDWVMQHMPKIQEVMGIAFQFISHVADQAAEMFKKFLIPVLQSLADWVQSHLPEIQAFFQTTFELIGEVIQVFVNLALKWWERFGSTIVSIAKIAFDTLVSVISNIFRILKGLLDVFIGLFTGDWSRMGEGLKAIWQGLWDGIASILSGAWGILSTYFSTLWREIESWFGGLKDSAVQWGKNMIQGFIDGIASMGAKVAEAAGNVVKQAADFLKFWSPAKKGEGRFIVHWGRNMIDGFLDGVEEMIPEAQASMNKVVGVMNPPEDAIEAGNLNYSQGSTSIEGLLVELIQAVKQGQNLQIDGKTFAKVTGDYTDEEGGVRVRRVQRGLAT